MSNDPAITNKTAIFTGIVENRADPLKLGRLQVRIHGLHSPDAAILPTSDLPWATPVMPSFDASVSGIGHSPTGIVQGSVVVIVFFDPFQQYPYVLGTLNGIPQSLNPFNLTGPNDITVLGAGDPPQPAAPLPPLSPPAFPSPIPPQASTLPHLGTSAPSAMTISQAGMQLIERFEGFRATAYQDSVGVWTIGYGTTIVNGQPVTPGMTITQEQANQLFYDFLQKTTVPAVQSVTVPLTQQMFDACCSLAYNIGANAFNGSTVKAVLNSGKYQESADHFTDWDKGHVNGQLVVIQGLLNRRQAEQQYFLSGGIPNPATNSVTPPTTTSTTTQSASAPSFVPGAPLPSSYIGAQSLGSNIGFHDPNNQWPSYIHEPDTNRLARGEQLGGTAYYKKMVMRKTGIPIGPQQDNLGTWDQPIPPYNATYPFNKVIQTESGHLVERDDTPHSERLHWMHRSGTFEEIDPNGGVVRRIVGDNYEIVDRNGYVSVSGNATVQVAGNTTIYVMNDANIYVDHNINLECRNDVTQNVYGDYTIKAKSFTFEAWQGDFNVRTDQGNVEIYSAQGNVGIDAQTDVNIQCGGSVPKTYLKDLTPQENSIPDFPDLGYPSAGLKVFSQYDENPADMGGNPQQFLQSQASLGNIDPATIMSTPTVDQPATPANIAQHYQVKTKMVDTSNIVNRSDFPASLQLSPNFTLGAFTKNGAIPLVAQFGLTPGQICANLVQVANNLAEVIRIYYPNFIITSGFRRPGDVAGSAPHSQHYLGQAADFYFVGKTRADKLAIAQDLTTKIDFDQMILETFGPGDSNSTEGWIHISYASPSANRRQLLTIHNSQVVAYGLALVSQS